MALSIDPATKVITVPQADLTLVTGTLYELDTNQFRKDVMALLDDEDYIWLPNPFQHNTEVTVAGTTFFRTIEFINGFSVEFEDGQYSVRLIGSNNNIFDVENGILVQNQVQVIPTNSAGGQVIETGVSGLTAQESAALALLKKLQTNKLITDPVTGVITIYDDDDTTPLVSGNIYEDAAATQPYRGRGSERRNKLT